MSRPRVLFHLTTPPPELDDTESVLADVQQLQDVFDGEPVFLLKRRSRSWRGRSWFRGLGQLRALRQHERICDAHFIFHSEFFPFLYLAGLKKPIIYSLVSELGERGLFPPLFILKRVQHIIVPDQQSADWLNSRGFTRTTVVHPGIDLTLIRPSDPPESIEPFRVLTASAPWTREQFETKGVATLLQACQQLEWLRLIFLWRGVLHDDMVQLVKAYGVEDRVQVINQFTDINALLATVHASIVLADVSRHVKAYPKSLIESLASGRPVIISDTMPMHNLVQDKKCGVVVTGTSLESLIERLQFLRQNYVDFQTRTATLNLQPLSAETMQQSYRSVVEQIIEA